MLDDIVPEERKYIKEPFFSARGGYTHSRLPDRAIETPDVQYSRRPYFRVMLTSRYVSRMATVVVVVIALFSVFVIRQPVHTGIWTLAEHHHCNIITATSISNA